MIIIEINKKIRRIYTVYPCRYVLYFEHLCVTGNGITKDYFTNCLSTEKADVKLLNRSDPVRSSVLIDLKVYRVKNIIFSNCRLRSNFL